MPTTTFCMCIEAGPLEQQSLLLCESIRMFAGDHSGSPIIAVRPRRGPEILDATREALRRMNVRYVAKDLVGEYFWRPHINKSAALSLVEEIATSDYVTWLDSDMIVIREPSGLFADDDFDYAARPGEADMGTGGDDGNAAFWRRASEIVGLDYRQFPRFSSFPEGRSIYAYWHGGVFTFRRTLRIGSLHFKAFRALLDARISSSSCGIYHIDQVAQTLGAHAAAHRFAAYAPTMNLDLTPDGDQSVRSMHFGDAKILHYHGALYPEAIGAHESRIAAMPKEVQSLLSRYAPFRVLLPFGKRVRRKAISVSAKRKSEQHERRCSVF